MSMQRRTAVAAAAGGSAVLLILLIAVLAVTTTPEKESNSNLRSKEDHPYANISVPQLDTRAAAKSIHINNDYKLPHERQGIDIVYACPESGLWPEIVVTNETTYLLLQRSSDRYMCGLAMEVKQGGERALIQLARSYSSNDWEITAGKFASKLPPPDCSITGINYCRVNLVGKDGRLLPELEGATLLMPYSERIDYSIRDQIARFLEQTTFGVTREEIQEIEGWMAADATNTTSQSLQHYFAKWIQNQQDNIPILSHRALFRRHTNDRLESHSAIAAPNPPCLAGARYRREAFSTTDNGKLLEVRRIGNSTRMAFLVEGQLRTVIEPPIYTQTFGWNGRVIELEWEDGFYTICKQDFRTFGESVVKVAHPDHKWCKPFLTKAEGGRRYYGNPPVSWTQQDLIDLGFARHIVAIPNEAARTIDDQWSAFTNEHSSRFTTPHNSEIILEQDLLLENDSICEGINTKDDLPWIATWKYEQYLYDPRPMLQDNDIRNPLEDGGGGLMKEHTDFMSSGATPLCSNVPRDFVNEDFCQITTSPNACAYRWFQNDANNFNSGNGQKVLFEVTPESLRAINEAAQADDSIPNIYLYAIEGLDANKDEAAPRPCTPGTKSSWISIPCSTATISRAGSDNMHPSTGEFFLENIQSAQNNNNPYVIEIQHEANSVSHCHPDDVDRVDLLLRDPGHTDRCWSSVHPDHLSVYDFANWVDQHPGGADSVLAPAQAGNVTLTFPSWHELSRWEQNKAKLQTARMKLGDTKNFFKLPIPLRTQAVANAIGIGDLVATSNAESLQAMLTTTTTRRTNNILVCGSPNEVANDPFLGGSWKRGGFTMQSFNLAGPGQRGLQREQVWFQAILNDSGQLRQRAAWALSQVLVVTAAISNSKGRSEAHLKYYDIFVRHAFGNYRDVLKEVSYSPIMGHMLSYVGGKSTAFMRAQSGVVLYADENYAREIMQLFTTGLIKLNRDGTEKYDADNEASLVYTNDDVEEYARAWTGFAVQRKRGNMEGADTPSNYIDPMRVMSLWRDPFPKMGLDENYVGDGKPLCSDLPLKHFLAKGATYVLLGGTPVPEGQEDPTGWNDYTMPDDSQLSLASASPLYQKLCSPNASGRCDFINKVVLDHPIDCYGQECLVDSVRSLEVAGMFYEYVRPPCVHPLFYENATTIVRRWGQTQAMCADPQTESATAACCDKTSTSSPVWAEQYFGERTLLSTADTRCNQTLCNPEERPMCHGTESLRCRDNNYIWTAWPCELKAKIDRVTGKVGIVHQPNDMTDSDVASLVQSSQPTYFRADYVGGYHGQLRGCETWAFCSVTEDDKCLCSVTISEVQVFDGFIAPSKEDIISFLHVGAFEREETAHSSSDDVKVYTRDASGALSKNTVFEVVDDYGIRQLRKNVKLLVQVTGTNITFRNPVHFLNLADPEARDAQYETEATLDHYFFHENTAPFLAIRFAQRFGISNPSPRFINTIASAFVSGSYTSESAAGGVETNFGTGRYGDLAATFAAVLLDREARNIVLDTDPNYGSLKEPLVKFVSLLRTFRFQPNRNPFAWADFDHGAGDKLGQWPHRIPSVFSFFLPEYSPKGRIGMGTLVSPESQVMTGPRIIDTMNGIFSLLKQGLTFCNDGFGPDLIDTCGDRVDYGDTSKGVGHLTFEPESYGDAIVDELATFMTAGRLTEATRQLIKGIYSSSDPLKGIIKAQMMIATAPEFHSTGTIRPKTVIRRSRPTPQASEKTYKALVYVFLKGGMDSYNVLAPHTCQGVNSNGQTLREQYDAERTTIGLADNERRRIIDASDQPCSQFAIHPQLPFVERLYNSGELSFFANVGHMEAPVTKDNYNAVTKAQLFAHNVMQDACYRTDPKDSNPGTGILGRMSDKLLEKGFKPQPLTVDEETSATVGESIPPLVGATLGVKKFSVPSEGEDFDLNDYVSLLNNATELRGNVFGETWSSKLRAAIDDAEMMADGLDKIDLEEVYPAEIVGDTVYPRTAEALSSIVLTHQHRGSDRDVIFVPLGSWDHHASVKSSSDREFQRLDKFLMLFEKEMKAKGIWDQVTVAVGSDFGRTLTPNSNEGSDHAWGGHYFMFGGSIKGGKIHGDYPSDITENGPLNIGRGRLLPTLSWESVFSSAAEWMGLETDEELDYVFPNRAGSGANIFPMSEVFDT